MLDVTPHLSTPGFKANGGQATLASRRERYASTDAEDRAFVSLLPVFRATGGLATGHEVSERFVQRQPDGLSKLARAIAAGEMISFSWQANLWLPMFQFDLHTMEMNMAVNKIISELRPIMDGWEITQWFAAPHSALANVVPLEALHSMPEIILDAARTERNLHR